MIRTSRLLLRRPAALRAVAPVRLQAAWVRRLSTEPQRGEQTTPSPEPEMAPPQGASRWTAVRVAGIFLGSALTFYATSAYLERTRESRPRPTGEKQAYRKRKAKPGVECDPTLIASAASPEQAHQMLSSQHAQLAHSWEHPGVWAWGNNTGRVVDPEDGSSEQVVKSPQRIRFFDGQVLRDLRMTKDFGVAVTDKGDLIQWGLGFSKENPQPAPTLVGKDIAKVAVTQDRIIALSADGVVYSLPASGDDQAGGAKLLEQPRSWSRLRLRLWSSPASSASVSYRDVTPLDLSGREKVVDISSGRGHCLMLTSRGRVFAAAASTLGFPSRGQLGVPGLSWARRPKDRPYDTPHEVTGLCGNSVVGIATGDHHSLALDKDGLIWGWGDNTFGQLGIDTVPTTGHPVVEAATLVPTDNLFAGTELVARVTWIAAGGTTTYFATEAMPGAKGADAEPVADLWACGQGVNGQLGNGRWSHVSGVPTRVKNLSSLTEYDERTKRLVPIRVASISAGTTHACAVVGNITRTDAAARSGSGLGKTHDTNWGADIMVWGGNEHFQLGTGRRSNSNKPIYVAPLDAQNEGSAVLGHERMQLAPRSVARIGGSGGRKVSVEQKVVCGEYVTAVYSAT